jgi:hypothetical protein
VTCVNSRRETSLTEDGPNREVVFWAWSSFFVSGRAAPPRRRRHEQGAPLPWRNRRSLTSACRRKRLRTELRPNFRLWRRAVQSRSKLARAEVPPNPVNRLKRRRPSGRRPSNLLSQNLKLKHASAKQVTGVGRDPANEKRSRLSPAPTGMPPVPAKPRANR